MKPPRRPKPARPSRSGEAGLRFVHLNPVSRYALLGMRALAMHAGRKGFGLVADSARRARLPATMLSKVFQRLVRRGLLRSQRGPGGGYALARPASSISLAEILSAVEDIAATGYRCLLHDDACAGEPACRLQARIARADLEAVRAFESFSLEDLACRREAAPAR